MDLKEFKKKAKATGFHFNFFAPPGFLDCYVAEIKSHKRYVGLYMNAHENGVSLVLGWNPYQKIIFFEKIEDIHAEDFEQIRNELEGLIKSNDI